MEMPPKIYELKKASGLESIYFGKTTKKRLDVKYFDEGAYIVPGMLSALKKLRSQVEQLGGNLYIIDLTRTWEQQAMARERYENDRHNHPFTAKPGQSFHNAGRAVDIEVDKLNFSSVSKDEQLSTFWEIAKPLGFRPIISIPDIEMSESWHFDYIDSDWEQAYSNYNYSEVAKACTILCGNWKKESDDKIKTMFVQSYLIKLCHFYIGKIDGILGTKTKSALLNIGLNNFDLDYLVKEIKKI